MKMAIFSETQQCLYKNSITEEIKNGVSWREVIKKYYSDNNPWLYKIITSEKRTRFIDSLSNPKIFQF